MHYRDEKWCSHCIAVAMFKGKVDDYIIQIASIDLSLNKIASSHININNGKKCLPRKRVKVSSNTPYSAYPLSSLVPTDSPAKTILLRCTSSDFCNRSSISLHSFTSSSSSLVISFTGTVLLQAGLFPVSKPVGLWCSG